MILRTSKTLIAACLKQVMSVLQNPNFLLRKRFTKRQRQNKKLLWQDQTWPFRNERSQFDTHPENKNSCWREQTNVIEYLNWRYMVTSNLNHDNLPAGGAQKCHTPKIHHKYNTQLQIPPFQRKRVRAVCSCVFIFTVATHYFYVIMHAAKLSV